MGQTDWWACPKCGAQSGFFCCCPCTVCKSEEPCECEDAPVPHDSMLCPKAACDHCSFEGAVAAPSDGATLDGALRTLHLLGNKMRAAGDDRYYGVNTAVAAISVLQTGKNAEEAAASIPLYSHGLGLKVKR